MHHFVFPLAMHKDSDFSTSSPTHFPFLSLLLFFFFLNTGHPSGYEVVSHCGFDLHFPNDWWYLASFYVPIDHLYTFGKVSIQILCPFFITLLIYFWLSYVFTALQALLKLRGAGLLSSCSVQTSHCSGFSCHRAWASVVTAAGR